MDFIIWKRRLRERIDALRGLLGGVRLRRAFAGCLSFLAIASAPNAFAQDQYVLLTFLHTNDLHGRAISGLNFEDSSRGGLARAATIYRRLKARLPNVLFVDSGDIIHGSPVEFLSKGQSMIDSMNAAGIELACPGNHEFDWGQDVAQETLSRANFPWVTANIVDPDSGKPFAPFQPYVIKEVDGVRIAFFGLTTLMTVDLEWPPFLSRAKFLDPVETAKKLVPNLRKKADLVVLLSHLGLEEDQLLAAQVPGIDLILGGHSHDTVTKRLEVNGTVIAQTGYYGQNVGRVDLIMKRDDAGQWRLESLNGRNGRWWSKQTIRPLDLDYPESAVIPLGPDIPPDPEVAKAYQPFLDRWESLRAESLGVSDAPVTDREDAPGDTPLSRLLADALRSATDADFSLVDGKWTGSLPAGSVPSSAVWDAMDGYTGQNILKYQATGAQIRRFLEQWAGSPKGLAVGISGLTATLDPKKPEGQRVIEAFVGGAPLDDAKTYQASGVMYVVRRYPSLWESAPNQIVGPVEWSRPLILNALKKMGRFAPDLKPRLIISEIEIKKS